MDSSKIISLDDFIRKENRYPAEEEALDWALQVCALLELSPGNYRFLDEKSIYIENGNRWTTANPPLSTDASEALFRAGAILHFALTRTPFRISHHLDGPPSIRAVNPQISVRFEAVVLRLLQTVRALRYAGVAELREDLEKLRKELSGDWTPHWSCFKGNNARTNSRTDASFAPKGKTLKEVWKVAIGEIWASPVMAGEYLFVGSSDGAFYSIDSNTGKIVWKLDLGARIESTPCIVENVAYLGNDLGNVYAINIKNGALLWKKALGDYVRSSACSDGANLYVGSISPTRKTGALWALSLKNGGVLWKKNLGPVFSSPLVDKGDVYVGSDDEYFYAFSSSGTDKWRRHLGGKVRSTALSVRESIYIGGFSGALYKLKKATGEVVWQNQDAGSMYSSPSYGKAFIVVGNNAGMVRFFQTATGKQIAEFATGGPVTASPLLVSQNVLIGSNDGHFYILDSQGTVLCSFDAKSPMNSSAYCHGGMVFVGTEGGLIALSV
jgi:outer membrane protein assembly factor BamB